ncbi:peroxiredoxin family protein [Aquimarina agarilytica]|uniref:peroxiredoxin family protein n=1 Tax=Aquimarina agarilytica TaxID=1087449 RepID=UPI0009D946F2|nr:TlpA disulfide reductase family protein [Aquimarina agarilytica]
MISKSYNKANELTKNSKYGKIIGTFIKLSKNPKKGDQFTDFTQNDSNGKSITFSNVKKKYTLIDFWASWCLPCKKLNPELRKVYHEFNAKGFEIVAVSLDQNQEAWLNAIRKDQLDWIQLSDLNGWENPVGYMYGVKNIPENFLIDTKGTIIDTRLNPKKLRKVLSNVLN